ncbi:8-oxo-dGTP diphosphatase [Mumia flava]|uniref:8-oxo-dGTP diphosphatase n=1 Tax=Mumia flava TaxID=1348852 RepID=A0A2M9BGT4_9ACTN|nr:NUDIX hydrolase [Mumia flava]PJJ57151.1 8-oxo-dGTP diphosphatase [Mumia flava]
MSTPGVRISAGAVVWRARGDDRDDVELLVVHRTQRQDWTIPKGTVEKGEAVPVAAVREVEEETGVRARLGVPLMDLEYEYTRGRLKRVSYWAARPVRGDADAYVPNKEIDQVRWVGLRKAYGRLSYDSDRAVLDAFSERLAAGALRSRTLVVARHARARSRSAWRKEPLARPLTASGHTQAHHLRPLLDAYAVHHVRTSGAVRCLQTLTPYAESAHRPLTLDHRLDEPDEGGPTKQRPVSEAMAELVGHKKPAAVCGHRPVLPAMLATLGLEADPLPPAGALVIHHRKGTVHAVERHEPR